VRIVLLILGRDWLHFGGDLVRKVDLSFLLLFSSVVVINLVISYKLPESNDVIVFANQNLE